MAPVDFVQSEIDQIVSKANFSPDEKKVFEMRNDCMSLKECAEELHMSVRTISRINKKIKIKILKVI